MKKYVHGPGIDEPLAIARASNIYFYHADGLGSIVALTNGTEATVQGYNYETFGRVKRIGSAVKNTYGFTGREYDMETGLYYYRARYYDPETGRFISKDPIGFAGGDANLYNYVLGDPINWTDPLGLINFLAGGGFSLTAPFGLEGSAGVVINPGFGSDKAGIGVFASGGSGGGVNISSDVFVGIVKGGISKINGLTANINLVLGPVSFTVITDSNTGTPIGLTVGYGPSAVPIGASGTLSLTSAVTFRDLLNAILGWNATSSETCPVQ